MIQDVIKQTEAKMQKSIEALKNNLTQIRTGRANASILDGINVDYYGVPTPINQMAAIKTPDAHQLAIEPWDKSQLAVIEKAINESDLGITPNNDGNAIRLPFPKLTEESRRDLVKKCAQVAEEARVSVRNARRDGNNNVKEEGLSEDEERRGQEEIQKLTDSYIKQVDEIFAKKEAEVMEI
ncbi:MAG: ribosome recycling factor [Coriobacteriia bacterium]|nr:ribosome recycling factor [Coriobacteriia bacterium]